MDTLYVKCWKLAFPTPTLKLVALAIARKSYERGYCWASQAVIAEDTGLNVRTVRRSIADLQELGWIAKVENRRNDGLRRTDHIWLTLPEVTLEAEKYEPDTLSALEGRVSASKRAQEPVDADSRAGQEDESEDEGEDEASRAGARESSPDLDSIDIPAAVAVIWAAVGDNGRKRSSRPKIENALRAALKRRPKGVAAEDHFKRILQGYRAYLADPDTRKEGGKFEHGAHRTLEGDVWETYLQGGGAVAPDAPDVDPDLGTTLEPGPKLQRLWAELAQQGMPWDAARGPRPGMPGCRISAEIQRQFGFTPYEGPEDDDDASAFA